MHRVFLGLGSNVGDRRKNLVSALRILDGMRDMEIRAVSSVYETEPWGVRNQPDFLNMVAMAFTVRDPRGVLDACKEVERELGRVRGERWGPRVIDVDVLLYDDVIWEEDDFIIPHPRMLEREFVTVPLLELSPRVTVPGSGDLQDSAELRGENKVRRAFRFDEEEWHG